MYQSTIGGLFLVFFSIADNYVGDVIGCKTRKVLMHNMFAKHISLIFFIYFAINLTEKEHVHPFENIKNTLFLWLGYIFFIRMNILFMGITFVLLILYYILNDYLLYFKDAYDVNNNENKNIIKNINTILEIIKISSMVLIAIGFSLYLIKQIKDHGKSFNIFKFLLGTKKC